MINKSDYIGQNISFSGCDMVVSIDMKFPDGTTFNKVVGSLQTLTYSVHMDKFPVRAIGNANAKDYTFGPRTIAGSLIFAVFNKHFAYEILEAAAKTSGIKQYHFLMDELPPFNITVSMANEYGETGRLALYGIRIVNEGQAMSVNDIYTENTYQFVATDIEYLNNLTGSSGGTSARTAVDSSISGSRGPVKPMPVPGEKEEEQEEFESINDGESLTISKIPYWANPYEPKEEE